MWLEASHSQRVAAVAFPAFWMDSREQSLKLRYAVADNHMLRAGTRHLSVYIPAAPLDFGFCGVELFLLQLCVATVSPYC